MISRDNNADYNVLIDKLQAMVDQEGLKSERVLALRQRIVDLIRAEMETDDTGQVNAGSARSAVH